MPARQRRKNDNFKIFRFRQDNPPKNHFEQNPATLDNQLWWIFFAKNIVPSNIYQYFWEIFYHILNFLADFIYKKLFFIMRKSKKMIKKVCEQEKIKQIPKKAKICHQPLFIDSEINSECVATLRLLNEFCSKTRGLYFLLSKCRADMERRSLRTFFAGVELFYAFWDFAFFAAEKLFFRRWAVSEARNVGHCERYWCFAFFSVKLLYRASRRKNKI